MWKVDLGQAIDLRWIVLNSKNFQPFDGIQIDGNQADYLNCDNLNCAN